jgi:hypothetical protein
MPSRPRKRSSGNQAKTSTDFLHGSGGAFSFRRARRADEARQTVTVMSAARGSRRRAKASSPAARSSNDCDGLVPQRGVVAAQPARGRPVVGRNDEDDWGS